MSEPEDLINGLDLRYKRFRAAMERGDALTMADEFAGLCADLMTEEIDPPDEIFYEMQLTWADLYWQCGRSDRSAEVLEQYLKTNPDDMDARLRHATALFHSCQFDGARAELQALETEDLDEADVYVYLAALAERDGDDLKAREYYATAEELDEDFHAPLDLDEDEAIKLFQDFLREAPEPIRRVARDVPVFCSPLPADELLMEEKPYLDPWTMGMFIGPDIAVGDLNAVPSPRILLFYRNIARYASDPETLAEEMRMTLFHEIGHYIGMDEAQLRAWEKGE